MDRREAKYWRGYGEGVYFRILQRMGESIREHHRLQEEVTNGNDDSYGDAYARGFRDGCKEKPICLVLPERDQSDPQRVNGTASRRPLDEGSLLATTDRECLEDPAMMGRLSIRKWR